MTDINDLAAAGVSPHPPVSELSASRDRLLELIKAKAIVHGRVTLSSGREAGYYVDLRRITLDGEAAPLVGQVMNELTKDLDFDAVGGLTLGADPVATAMLHASNAAGRRLDAFVVRKAGKAHGLQQRIEGPSIKGRRVVIVEDTTTTGASPMDAVAAAREEGAEVVAVATIADRATGAKEKLEAQGLTYVSAYSLQELGLA
ncbi:MAG: orotate phosphoribosyltransferase [Actinomycetota bacterium]|jgi:orotate phosphoribosyltransferase|nr:orotate phosphoribosyltransferase [Actinomycetota bacterium]